jgi:uncharacterized protein
VLLESGADVGLASVTDGYTAVSIAAERGNIEAVSLLLQYGADPFDVDEHGRDSVYRAAAVGSIELMQLLLKHGAPSADSISPLLAAATRGHVECAEWLLSNGAQINAADREGWTVLHVAAAKADERMYELLLRHGADAHACTKHGEVPLHALASTSGSVPCARLLLTAGADAARTNGAGVGALHAAVQLNHTELVQLLLQHGAAVLLNARCPLGCICERCGDMPLVTPVMGCPHPAMTKLLLAAGSVVHMRSNTGNTCLHIAALHSYSVPVVCLLIKAGADIAAVNDYGDTAAQIARNNGNDLLAAVLDRAAAQQA